MLMAVMQTAHRVPQRCLPRALRFFTISPVRLSDPAGGRTYQYTKSSGNMPPGGGVEGPTWGCPQPFPHILTLLACRSHARVESRTSLFMKRATFADEPFRSYSQSSAPCLSQ